MKHRTTSSLRAMKIIQIASSSKDQVKLLSKEINILKELDHPNIIKVYEFYSNQNNFFIINELCTGGELFDKIIEVKYFSERVAANIMMQLFSAVNFCHANKVIHRDLKPENILIETQEQMHKEFFHIKVIDFGTSDFLNRNKMLKEQIGTSFYIAPEVLKNSYNEKCDLWSCGVILYILLCGAPPFYGSNEDEIFEMILSGLYSFKHSIWNHISSEGKELVIQLLELDSTKRLSAKEAMEHKWFKKMESSNQLLKNIPDTNLISIITNISNFRAEQKLQQATLAFLVHNLSNQEEISELKEVFLAFDVNNDGRLTKNELLEGMSKILTESNVAQSVDALMKTIDSDNNGYIEFEEFIRASINKEKLCTEKNLKIAFDEFDKDKSGGISASELKQILGDSNRKINDDVWKKMINEIDLNGDGQISFDEFKNMMLKVINHKKDDTPVSLKNN